MIFIFFIMYLLPLHCVSIDPKARTFRLGNKQGLDICAIYSSTGSCSSIVAQRVRRRQRNNEPIFKLYDLHSSRR
jgi:hypothetical protein